MGHIASIESPVIYHWWLLKWNGKEIIEEEMQSKKTKPINENVNLWKQGNTQEKGNVTFICLEFSNANTINIFCNTF
jgi:hypothetical protein